MFSPAAGSSKARPPAVEVPSTVATDADEGSAGANSLLAGEALRLLGSNQVSTAGAERQQPSLLQDNALDTVLAMPDSHNAQEPFEQASVAPYQGVDTQPLLDWLQSSSQARRVQRRQSELQSAPLRPAPIVHRSMSETADADEVSTGVTNAARAASPQPFYGVGPRRAVRRDPSSQLLSNMQRSMRAPYRQQSLLSHGSPPVLSASRRWVSHDHETGHPSHAQEMIEMPSNPLSRIASDAPESSGGSILVEVSPDSYEPLTSVIQEMPGLLNQLPMMLEEEAEVCVQTCQYIRDEEIDRVV